jgi:hypothetical protein
MTEALGRGSTSMQCRTGQSPGIGLLTLIALSTLFASAAVANYTALERPARNLVIRSSEPESDAILRASCRKPGAIELRLGAEFQVGKGDGAIVELVVKSGGKTVRIAGTSKPSVDQQMTGGTELLTQVQPDDPIFDVLASQGEIRFSGSVKDDTKAILGPSVSAALKRFLDHCRLK